MQFWPQVCQQCALWSVLVLSQCAPFSPQLRNRNIKCIREYVCKGKRIVKLEHFWQCFPLESGNEQINLNVHLQMRL